VGVTATHTKAEGVSTPSRVYLRRKLPKEIGSGGITRGKFVKGRVKRRTQIRNQCGERQIGGKFRIEENRACQGKKW